MINGWIYDLSFIDNILHLWPLLYNNVCGNKASDFEALLDVIRTQTDPSTVCKICAEVFEVNVCVSVGIFGYSGYFENSFVPNVCVTTGAGSGFLLTDGAATLFSPCICSLPPSLSLSLTHLHFLLLALCCV